MSNTKRSDGSNKDGRLISDADVRRAALRKQARKSNKRCNGRACGPRFHGELDQVPLANGDTAHYIDLPLAAKEAAASRARRRGATIELTIKPGQGHARRAALNGGPFHATLELPPFLADKAERGIVGYGFHSDPSLGVRDAFRNALLAGYSVRTDKAASGSQIWIEEAQRIGSEHNFLIASKVKLGNKTMGVSITGAERAVRLVFEPMTLNKARIGIDFAAPGTLDKTVLIERLPDGTMKFHSETVLNHLDSVERKHLTEIREAQRTEEERLMDWINGDWPGPLAAKPQLGAKSAPITLPYSHPWAPRPYETPKGDEEPKEPEHPMVEMPSEQFRTATAQWRLDFQKWSKDLADWRSSHGYAKRDADLKALQQRHSAVCEALDLYTKGSIARRLWSVLRHAWRKRVASECRW